MRLTRVSSAFLAAAFLVACGGGEPAESEPAAEAAVASAAPSCYTAVPMEEATARPSPLSTTAFSVGGHDGVLCYGAPSANGRVVMGELVPMGEPWRVGANEATAIHLSGPAQVGGVDLAAGSYSLYAIPGETEWTFYLNSTVERWGIPISDEVRATEVGSFTAAVESMDGPVETLTFRFEPWEDGTMGDMVMEWETTRVKFPLPPTTP